LSLRITVISLALLAAACAKATTGDGVDAGGAGGGDARPADAAAGCSVEACNDDDACTIDSCSPEGMCAYEDVDCNDDEACTADTCDSVTGCTNTWPSVMGDTCPAEAIDVSASGGYTGDSTCAANDGTGLCGAGDAPDIYFVFNVSEISDVTIDTIGSSFDAVLSLGTTCTGGELGCDDDSAGGTDAVINELQLAPGTYYVTLDGKAGAAGGAWTLNVAIAPSVLQETVSFPAAGDTINPTHGYLWTLGSFVEGVRTTGVSSATSVDMHLVLAENLLTCDTQDMRMLVNGVQVGTFAIASGATVVDLTFSFAAIAGPTYTLRYENTRAVNGGCGSARPDMTGMGSVTIYP
jgi:hypothetical protein